MQMTESIKSNFNKIMKEVMTKMKTWMNSMKMPILMMMKKLISG